MKWNECFVKLADHLILSATVLLINKTCDKVSVIISRASSCNIPISLIFYKILFFLKTIFPKNVL